MCAAGESGWKPVAIVVLAALRYCLPIQLGLLLHALQLTAAPGDTLPLPAASTGGGVADIALSAARLAGAGAGGGLLGSLLGYAKAAMDAAAFAQLVAWDAAVFLFVLVGAGAVQAGAW